MSCFVIIALPDFSSCLSANSFFSHCSDIVTNMLWKEWINLIITFLVLLKQQWERPEEFLYYHHLCSRKNYIIVINSSSKEMWSLIELLTSLSGSRNPKLLSFAKFPKIKERTTEMRLKCHPTIVKMTLSILKCVISSTNLIHNFQTISLLEHIIYQKLLYFLGNFIFTFPMWENHSTQCLKELSLKRRKSLERRNESCQDSLQRCQNV